MADKLRNIKILRQITPMFNSSKAIMHLVAIGFGCLMASRRGPVPISSFSAGLFSLETEELNADKIKMLFNEIQPDLFRVLDL